MTIYLIFILILLIYFSEVDSLRCYSQRCRLLDTGAWICNFYNNVEIKCDWDEVCFEMDGPKFKERTCTRKAFILGHQWDLYEFIQNNHPQGGYDRIEDINRGTHLVFGNIDFCNNILEWSIPSSFGIAGNIKCYETECHKRCDYVPGEFSKNCLLKCSQKLPGQEVYCGSELDWACRTIQYIKPYYMRRECVDIDSYRLNPLVKYRLDSGEKSFCSDPDGNKIDAKAARKHCYCTTTLCNTN